MSDSELDVVTGALSYTGRHVARLLLGQAGACGPLP
ncbi:MAG: hypothetical protein JWP02_777, partial [Acidimicrobiales bacterium]|nr:hypothetical protein [Acidimicrobiales bacterium]